MGLVDTAIQQYAPVTHTIVKAHPQVYECMLRTGWGEKDRAKIFLAIDKMSCLSLKHMMMISQRELMVKFRAQHIRIQVPSIRIKEYNHVTLVLQSIMAARTYICIPSASKMQD